MKFAIIGLDAPNTFSVKMQKALKKLGHSVYFLSKVAIQKQYCPTVFKAAYHLNMKHPIDLREILPVENYDAIIISHNVFTFNNPKIGSTKVIYYHREFLDYPSCLNPDVLAYSLPCHDKWIWYYHPQLWHSAKRIDLNIAVDPEEYNPHREKDLKGLNFASTYEDVMEEKRDYTWNNFYGVYIDRIKKFTANGCRVNGGKYIDSPELKDYIERSEAFLNFMPPGIFASRRLLECAASQTVPVIHIESIESKNYHNKLGFENGENCIMFTDNTPFPSSYNSTVELALNAYEMVLKNHTYDHRAKQIIDLLN